MVCFEKIKEPQVCELFLQRLAYIYRPQRQSILLIIPNACISHQTFLDVKGNLTT